MRLTKPFYLAATQLRFLKPDGKKRDHADDFSMAVPFNYPVQSTLLERPIAIVAHIFHADLIAAMRGELENIPYPADLFISTDTEEKRAGIVPAFADWQKGSCEVRLSANRGRDIAPKYITFRDVYDDHELVLFVHSKRTPHPDEHRALAPWRETMMATLVGSPDIVRSVIATFQRFPKLGMLIPQHYEPVREWLGWGWNRRRTLALARRMGIRLKSNQTVDFAAGSMFWARTQTLRPFLDLKLTIDEFPPEQGQTDSTIAHALERLVLYACEHTGFTWAKIAAPGLYRQQATIVPIGSADTLDRFMRDRRYDLLS
jgi:lipopolysaccharide biosynthesis protein